MNERYQNISDAKKDLEDITSNQAKPTKAASVENITVPLEQLKKSPVTRPTLLRQPQPMSSSVKPALQPEPVGAEPIAKEYEVPSQQKQPSAVNLKFSWVVVVITVLIVMGAILLFLLPKDPGFTLVINGVPLSSTVYIDNVVRGVPTVDGTIKIQHLKAGKRLVKVTNEGYTDFNSSTSGDNGETRSLIAQLTLLETKPISVASALPNEIDYTGDMILIPAGEFIMGDDNHQPSEKPAHKVNLPDYYIDKYEVTNAQYKRFCEETGYKLPTSPWWDEQYITNNPNSPVVGVSWNDASAYAKWAGKRLPTEQEWEKAASWDVKAQKKRLWPWSDSPETNRANFNSLHPTSINQYPAGASSYGVQDLAGNAAEWVDSFYQPYPGNLTTDKDYGTTNKVVRGGSFRSGDDDTRTTRRLYHSPEFQRDEMKTRSWLIGFRTVVFANDPRLLEFLKPLKTK